MVDVPRSIIDKRDEARVRQELIDNLPPPELGKGMARAFFGEGVGMGWGDEAEALLRSKSDNLLGEGDYRAVKEGINKEYGRFADYYPKTSALAEFAGGAAPALALYAMSPATGGASLPAATAAGSRAVGALSRLAASPYAKGAKIGTAQGAITSAGQAKDTSDLSGNIIGGGGVGAVIGAGAPVAIRGAGAGLNWLKERFVPTEKFVQNRANKQMLDALENDKIKPGDLLKRVEEDASMDIPGMIGTASPSLARLSDTVTNRAGKAAAGTRLAFDELKQGSRERVMDMVQKGISNKNYFRDEADAVANLRKNADTLYDEAYAFGEVRDPRLLKALEQPKFASYFEKAKEIAETKAMAAELRGEDPSKYQLKKLYKTNTDKDGNLVGFELVDVPDVRTLDYIKHGIDATIEAGYQGKGLSKAEASSLKDLRKIFVDVIDEATVDPKTGKSAYAIARKEYAGDMEVLDAMRLGKAYFNKLDSEQIKMLMKDMSSAEKEALRTGVTSNLYDIIMNPSNEINAAKRLIESKKMKERIGALFEDSDAKRDLLMTALQRESQMFKYAQAVTGGSGTAERLAREKALGEGSNFGEMVASAITQGQGPGSALIAIAARAMSKARMTDDVAEEISKKLISKNPSDVAKAVQELEEYAATRTQKAEKLSAVEQAVGSGINVARPPSPVDEEAAQERVRKSIFNERPKPATEINVEEMLADWRKRNLRE